MMEADRDGLLAVYALGALSENELGEVERLLAEDAEARRKLREFQQTTSALSYLARPEVPSADVRVGLLDRVQREEARRWPARRGNEDRTGARPAGPRSWLGRWAGAAVGASIVLAAVAVASWLALGRNVAELRAQNAELLRQLSDHQQAISLVGQPGLIAVQVEGTEDAPGAEGHFLGEAEARTGVLLVSGLSPLAPGMTYQAWLIREGMPSPAGTFQVTAAGVGTLSLEVESALGSYEAVAVSLEPEGGSLLPSGAIVLLGRLKG